jgi:hypothetical protein
MRSFAFFLALCCGTAMAQRSAQTPNLRVNVIVTADAAKQLAAGPGT